MTQRIVELLEVDPRSKYERVSALLNFVCGAMIGHESASGASPFAGIDVERLFSAVRLLADRQNLEVSPFVASWHRTVEEFERRNFPAFFEDHFRKAVLNTRALGSPLERMFKEGVEALTGPGDGSLYRELLSRMTVALRSLVRIDEPSKVSYLTPLIDLYRSQESLAVATLNYDLSVELLAEQQWRHARYGR